MRATLRLTEIIPGLHVGMPVEQAHEVILAEVERLRGLLSQVAHDIGEEGYAVWSLKIYGEIDPEQEPA